MFLLGRSNERARHVRQILPEWYSPSETELGTLLRTATIALDANVLLDLYRVSTTQRDQILDLLAQENVRPRVWVPYQAALEYQRNRLKVAREHEGHYRAVQKAIDELSKDLRTAILGLRDKAVRTQLNAKVDEALGPVVEQLTTEVAALGSANVIPADGMNSIDPIRDRIDAVLANDDQVGPKPTDETINERKSQVDGRYSADIPPGYADKAKPDSSGDLLIWFEVLERAEKRPDESLILITGDTKPDWYLTHSGKTLGPRTELVAEYRTHAGAGTYHQMTLDSFLHHANTHLGGTVEASTIATVELLAEARVTRAKQKDAILDKYPHADERLRMALTRMPRESADRDMVKYAVEMLADETPFEETAFVNGLRIADDFITKHVAHLQNRVNAFVTQRDFREKLLGGVGEQAALAGMLKQAIVDHPELGTWLDVHSSVDDRGLKAALAELGRNNAGAYNRFMAAVEGRRTDQTLNDTPTPTDGDDDELNTQS